MSGKPIIPPNFVSLRHLKELKEKRDEEARLQKLKQQEAEAEAEEEQQQRIRKLEEEEEESLKDPTPPKPSRTEPGKSGSRLDAREWRERGPRWSANLDGHVAVDGGKKKTVPLKENGNGMTEMPLGRNGSNRSDRVSGSHLGHVAAIEKGKKKKKKKKGKNEKEKEPLKEGENEMTEMLLGLSGSDRSVTVSGSHLGPATEIEKGKKEKKEKEPLKEDDKEMTEMPLVCHRSELSKNKAKGIRSSGRIDDIEKRVSDLKAGGRNPALNRRGRGRGFGNGRRSGGGGGNLMWVKKAASS